MATVKEDQTPASCSGDCVWIEFGLAGPDGCECCRPVVVVTAAYVTFAETVRQVFGESYGESYEQSEKPAP